MITLCLHRIGDRVNQRPKSRKKPVIVPFAYGIGDFVNGSYVVNCFYDFEDVRFPAYTLANGVTVLQRELETLSMPRSA